MCVLLLVQNTTLFHPATRPLRPPLYESRALVLSDESRTYKFDGGLPVIIVRFTNHTGTRRVKTTHLSYTSDIIN